MDKPYSTSIRPGHPDFSDLPWHLPVTSWKGVCERLEEVPRGISRHPVAFVNYANVLYSLKEMPSEIVEMEYSNLVRLEELKLPAVSPVGYVMKRGGVRPQGVLITRYLDFSIPFRSLFIGTRLVQYQKHLLDAIAGLLVQLHLAEVYWGDCSLSNTLFRRDAGALQAYLVDAETAEIYSEQEFSPRLRHDDLLIMDNNISGELADLAAEGLLPAEVPHSDASSYIRLRYQRLWEEITVEQVINRSEHYRIQERIRALNELGFSVGDVALRNTLQGDQLRLRVFVTDRNFHHDQLQTLTGIEAEERQAQKIMNEIQELKAYLSQDNNRSVSLSAAAYHWLKTIYEPTLVRLEPVVKSDFDTAELYCQLLEHKWYLSEKARRDVGHMSAVDDYLENIATL
jgi:hypothetical protein